MLVAKHDLPGVLAFLISMWIADFLFPECDPMVFEIVLLLRRAHLRLFSDGEQAMQDFKAQWLGS
jgi:hypothetical protein